MSDKALDIKTGYVLIGAGFFNADAGAPAWFWQMGFLAAVTRNAAGDYSLTMEGGGMVAGSGIILVSGGETEAAQRSTRFGVTHTSATVKRITTMQETGAGGGAASAAADKDFFIAVFRRRF